LAASSKGNKYILTVKDCFTRGIEAFPIVAATALETVDILVKEIFCRYGVPEIIHSDRGNQFTFNLFHSVAQEYGIQVTTTPAYNPKSNPVERVHWDLGTML
jgi:transposase InsO family protein